MCFILAKGLFVIAFEESKSAFNTQKVIFFNKKKLKILLNVQNAQKESKLSTILKKL